eukprot:654182-Prymnesium_polylepis.2
MRTCSTSTPARQGAASRGEHAPAFHEVWWRAVASGSPPRPGARRMRSGTRSRRRISVSA